MYWPYVGVLVYRVLGPNPLMHGLGLSYLIKMLQVSSPELKWLVTQLLLKQYDQYHELEESIHRSCLLACAHLLLIPGGVDGYVQATAYTSSLLTRTHTCLHTVKPSIYRCCKDHTKCPY